MFTFIIEGVLLLLVGLSSAYLLRLYCMIQLIKPVRTDIVFPTYSTTASPSIIELMKASSPLAQGFVSVLLFFVQIVIILFIKYLYERYKRRHTLVPNTPTTAAYLHFTDILTSKTIRLFHINECIIFNCHNLVFV